MFTTDCVLFLYAFLSHSLDCDETWYRDRLDFMEEDMLNFVAKKINKSPGRFSNRDFEIIIIFIFVYKWLLLVLIITIIIYNAPNIV